MIEVVQNYFKNSQQYGCKYTVKTLKEFLKDHGIPHSHKNKYNLTVEAYDVICTFKDEGKLK